LRNRSAALGTEQNLESRAKNARWIRTLTFILSLTGRGEERRSVLRKGLLTERLLEPDAR